MFFCVAVVACAGEEIFTKKTYKIWKQISDTNARVAEGEEGFWARETFATCRTDPDFDRLDREAMHVAGGELNQGDMLRKLKEERDKDSHDLEWCLQAKEKLISLQKTIRPSALLAVEVQILAFCTSQVEKLMDA